MSQSQVLVKPNVADPSRAAFSALFILLLACGITYAGYELLQDLVGIRYGSTLGYVLLTIALLIALAFEFVNGFHDTANAVATVIYTNSLKPHTAVVWSGVWNFIGVLISTGTIAFGIISLLPVELILQVGSHAGFAMVFALLLSAILWNVGTWYFGLPSSSSHTLIGSIIGVGLMNQIMQHGVYASGVDWSQAIKIGYSLLLSPLIGFTTAALMLLGIKVLIKNPSLYQAPEGQRPPPIWIRLWLILTCTGVSFAHGSNDGQKGMGLIMLILIGTVPTAYALNKAVPSDQVHTFVMDSRSAAEVLANYSHFSSDMASENPRADIQNYLKIRQPDPLTFPALYSLIQDIGQAVSQYGTYAGVPDDMKGNIRNDMYLVSEALRLLDKSGSLQLAGEEKAILGTYKRDLDHATKFIPGWVKVAVAIALGLGTMVGWRRIVVTVGEKIGKSHLTYGQGASAEMVAVSTIGAADALGLPVSTTHVLSSGVAGTMAANRSGLQWTTVRNMLTAWVLTLPMSITIAGGLFWILSQLMT
jgi:PiT family inorganic phosphate transporter